MPSNIDTVSGYYRNGVMVADRHARPVTAIADPQDGVVYYVTQNGYIVAREVPTVEKDDGWFEAIIPFSVICFSVGVWLLVAFLGLSIFSNAAHGEDMPAWVLPGIAARESHSYYLDGGIKYVDRKDGDAGERGPFQLTRGAFDQVAKVGDSFDRVRYDVIYAEQMTIRYLFWLHKRTRDWFLTVAKYNTGLHGDYRTGWRYAKDVQLKGQKAIGTQ